LNAKLNFLSLIPRSGMPEAGFSKLKL